MQECIFCKIIKGEIDSVKIYEDDEVFAFLDINPVSLGHTLVIPKKHYKNIFDVNDDVLQKVAVVGKKIAKALKDALKSDGTNILQSNELSAGQVIMHFHLHIIPRYENDGLKKNKFFGERDKSTDIKKLKNLAEKIKV